MSIGVPSPVITGTNSPFLAKIAINPSVLQVKYTFLVEGSTIKRSRTPQYAASKRREIILASNAEELQAILNK